MDILHTDQDGTFRVVRLFSEHTRYSSQETLARMAPAGVTLVQLTDDEDEEGHNTSTERSYTAQEMDALLEAWTAFKANLAACQEQDKARQAEVLKEAMKLAGEIEEIEITTDTGYGEGWEVKIPAIGYSYHRYAFSPDTLLEQVKGTVEAWDEHLSRLNEGKQEDWKGWNTSHIAEHIATLNKYAHRLNTSASDTPADEQVEEEASC